MELKETFQKVKAASKTLGLLTDEQRNEILQAVADAIIAEAPALLKANAEDLAKMDKANPLYDRLQLTEQRLQDIASDMRRVTTLGLMPKVFNTLWISSTPAVLEASASFPPFSTHAFPLLKQREKTS